MSFWDKYEQLCNEKGLKPSSDYMVGITGVSSAGITKWKKGATPNYKTIVKIAKFFGVSERYLSDLSDSPNDEDIVEMGIDHLLDSGAEVESFDDDNGAGQEYVVTYEGKSHNYQEQEFRQLCRNLKTELNDAQLQALEKFCKQTFNNEVVQYINYTKEEMDLIEKYRKLTNDSKTIINATIIKEFRRQE